MRAIVVYFSPHGTAAEIEAVAVVNDDAPELQPEALGAFVADCHALNYSVRVIPIDTVGDLFASKAAELKGWKAELARTAKGPSFGFESEGT